MTNGVVAGALVDTNIVVYAYDPRDHAKQSRAIDVLERLRSAGAGVLSAQALGEFFVTVTRKLPMPMTPAEAEREVTRLVRSWPVFDLTPAAVLEAIRGVQDHRLAYYDALMWAVAKLNGVPYLLSEDFTDGRLIETVRCLNPLLPGFDASRLMPR